MARKKKEEKKKKKKKTTILNKLILNIVNSFLIFYLILLYILMTEKDYKSRRSNLVKAVYRMLKCLHCAIFSRYDKRTKITKKYIEPKNVIVVI